MEDGLRRAALRDGAAVAPIAMAARKAATSPMAREKTECSGKPRQHALAAFWLAAGAFGTLGIEPYRGRLFVNPDYRRGCGVAPWGVMR